MNFQMCKLGLEKAEEPEINLLTFVGSWRKQNIKISTSASLTMLKPLTCGRQQTVEILRRVLDHLTYLLRNLYVGPGATVRSRHGRTDWFKIGKGVQQVCMLSPCLFNLYSEDVMQNSMLDELQAGMKIAGRNISDLTYTDNITLIAKVKRN